MSGARNPRALERHVREKEIERGFPRSIRSVPVDRERNYFFLAAVRRLRFAGALAAAFFGAAFFGAAFFFAALRLAGAFLAAAFFGAAFFFAALRLAGAFLAAAFFGAAFFFAALRLAGAFLAAAFFGAALRLAGAFFAAAFFFAAMGYPFLMITAVLCFLGSHGEACAPRVIRRIAVGRHRATTRSWSFV